VSALTTLAAAEWGGQFEGAFDDIVSLFDMPTIVDLGILSINRTILIIFAMTLIAMGLFYAAFRKASATQPGKLQLGMESLVGFIRDQVALEIIGPKGLPYVPLLASFFVFILFLNFAKITPAIMLPPTSRISIVLFLALISWAVYIGVGVKYHGLAYFKDAVVPPGAPKILLPILALLEGVSVFVLRPFTLAIRLFANMVAGHILVVITLVTVHVFLYPRPGLPIGVFGLVASPVVFGFELFIIVLQAYIFTMLTAVYIESSINLH
jgi:F-type H+-transporting ATPase subunit a